ncbi:MAG: hypothetical protein NW206_11095 [Hyphomonadaceae bacterium]|nr:hypothetical protein [Hyphomonadaceae bacterium]
MTSPAATQTQSQSEPQHWEQIAFFLRQALVLFGDPAALAQRLWLSARDHQLFVQFIGPIEDMLRRLLFITALELAPINLPPTPERKFRAARGFASNSGAHFDPTQPDSWRVAFKLSPALERRRVIPGRGEAANPEPRRPKPQPASKTANAQRAAAPCALRLEALLRAYENRDQLAAALARKIARNAGLALGYIFKKRKRSKAPDYVTHDFAALANEAHQRFLMRKLDTLKPDSS